MKVSGNAEVKVKPDIAVLTVQASATEKTTSEALDKVNKQINAVLQIIKSSQIREGDYSTSSFNISPDYDYSNGESILVGQKASQTLTVKIRDLTANGRAIGKFIDDVSQINGIAVNGVQFDQSDRTLGKTQARKAAFESAKKKA